MSTMNPQFASTPATPSSLLRSFARSPFDPRTWRANLAIVLGAGISWLAFAGLAATFSTGGSLLFLLVGIPIIALGIEISRLAARAGRWCVSLVDHRPLRPHVYRHYDADIRPPYGAWLRQWAEAQFLDGNRWRDVVYVVVSLPLSMIEFVLAFTLWIVAIALLVAPIMWALVQAFGWYPTFMESIQGANWYVRMEANPVGWSGAAGGMFVAGLILVPVAASVSRGMMMLHRAVVEGLLCTNESTELRRQVERLQGSRSAALEVEASELRRIERDLHDGAQQRLVMLAIDLGLATDRLDADPAVAKGYLADAREQARLALVELRELVRGTAPSILVDRGLAAALSAVAGRTPMPTVVDCNLAPGERLPHAVERAAYFVVAEGLTNAAKHSQAKHCEVRCRRDGDRLVVQVCDDGVGGAAVAPGGGLAGLSDRVQSLDGAFAVSSPAGGPTIMRAELPVRQG